MSAYDINIIEYCRYLWEEYKYRHDLIWQRIFRFTAAVVLLSIIPYVQDDIARMLGIWILIAPILATILAGFVLIIMRNELKLFKNIKTAYRKEQNKLLDDDLKHDLEKESNFNGWVLFYLRGLIGLSLANGVITFFVWMPKILENPLC